jgi:hypothetical protein
MSLSITRSRPNLWATTISHKDCSTANWITKAKNGSDAEQQNFVFEEASGKNFVFEIGECRFGIKFLCVRPFQVATQTTQQHCLCELVCAQYCWGMKPSNHAVKRSHKTESYIQDCRLDWQRRPRLHSPVGQAGPACSRSIIITLDREKVGRTRQFHIGPLGLGSLPVLRNQHNIKTLSCNTYWKTVCQDPSLPIPEYSFVFVCFSLS